MEFGVKVFFYAEKLSSKREFRENTVSGSRTLPKDVNYFFSSLLSTFRGRFW